MLAALWLTSRDVMVVQAYGDTVEAAPEVRALTAVSAARMLEWVRVLDELRSARRWNIHQGLLLTLLHSRMLG